MSVLRVSFDDGVASIRFDRPEALNAINVETAEEFEKAARGVCEDNSVRAIVLSGAGRAFMAGGDLAYLRAAEDRRAALLAVVEPTHAALKLLQASPAIVISSVQGAAFGAGMSIAIGADLCIAADTLKLGFAYTAVGAPGDCGGTWALPQIIGLRRAMEFALLGDAIDAERALALGLVNKVVPEVELEAETAKLARKIANGPPIAQGHIKSLMRGASSMNHADQLDIEARAFADCAGGDDFAEALSAFFEKRPPKFTGR